MKNKYNIIIGEDTTREYKSAYKKIGSDVVEVRDNVKKDDLTSDTFMFTESEIEDLKSILPENMAKIVDLGKVEVGND